MKMLEEGNASFIPIVQKWIFDRSSSIVPEPQRAWYNSVSSWLNQQGFKFNGLAVEKKGTPYETVAIDYIKGDTSYRLMFFDGLPPLVQVRTRIKGKQADVFALERKGLPPSVHPFAELYVPKTTFDGTHGIYTASEVRLAPQGTWTPEEMIEDYRAAFAKHYKNGLKGLRSQPHIRAGLIGKFPFTGENREINTPLLYSIAPEQK
jgi:hypothetical protein